MEFVETGHRREERPDLPVSFLMVLHALRLECETSMELTASSHHSCFFCSSWGSGEEAALLESPLGFRRRSDRGPRTRCPSMAHSSSASGLPTFADVPSVRGETGCFLWVIQQEWWEEAVNSKGHVRVAAVPSVRGETGCFLWVIQQSKVVGCGPEVQALTVRKCFVVTPVDMLAVEVTNIQAGMRERRDGRWCESRAWSL